MPKPHVTYQILRDIAETASGLRNQDLYFTVWGEPARYSWTTQKVVEGPDNVVIFCGATNDPPTRVRKASIGDGATSINLMKVNVRPSPEFPHPPQAGPFKADAVFWSVSAIEKFLAPYYVSVYGDQGAEYARHVLNVLMASRSDDEPGDSFAVAHLPSSEYVPLTDTPGEARHVPHLAVLTSRGVERLRLRTPR